jgi:CRISPR-associated protein Cas2
MLIVIAYDITDNERRENVANELENYGMRVQKSVFECRLDGDELTKLSGSLDTMIDATSDHVRFYRLCEKDACKIEIIGVKVIYKDEDYFMV